MPALTKARQARLDAAGGLGTKLQRAIHALPFIPAKLKRCPGCNQRRAWLDKKFPGQG